MGLPCRVRCTSISETQPVNRGLAARHSTWPIVRIQRAAYSLARRTGQTVMDDTSLSKSLWCGLVALASIPLLIAPVGCSPFIGTTSKSFLREVKDNPDPNIRFLAYAKLGSPAVYESTAERDEAVRLLIIKLQEAKEPVAVRAVIVRSLGGIGDRRARPEIIKAVNDVENAVIRLEACRALGKVGLPEDATILARVMTVDKLEDCRIAAIEGLGILKANDPRILGVLLDGMENDDPAIRLECVRRSAQSPEKTSGPAPPRGARASSRRSKREWEWPRSRPRQRSRPLPRNQSHRPWLRHRQQLRHPHSCRRRHQRGASRCAALISRFQ